jgi:hypothetical protein
MGYRVGMTKRLLAVSLAAGLGVALLDSHSRADAAGIAVSTFAARGEIVLAQATPVPDKKADSQKPKKSKRRAVRCGGPGLPDCPM